MPGVNDSTRIFRCRMKRQGPSRHDDRHDGPAGLSDFAYECFLRSRQVEERAGVRFSRKNLLLAEKQKNHIRHTRFFERIAKAILAEIAAIL